MILLLLALYSSGYSNGRRYTTGYSHSTSYVLLSKGCINNDSLLMYGSLILLNCISSNSNDNDNQQRTGRKKTKTILSSKMASSIKKYTYTTKRVKKIQSDDSNNISLKKSLPSSNELAADDTDSNDSNNDSDKNVDSLTIDERFRIVLKDCRKTNAPKKLIRAVAEYSESGRLDQNMTVHAFRTLQRMNRFVIVSLWSLFY